MFPTIINVPLDITAHSNWKFRGKLTRGPGLAMFIHLPNFRSVQCVHASKYTMLSFQGNGMLPLFMQLSLNYMFGYLGITPSPPRVLVLYHD